MFRVSTSDHINLLSIFVFTISHQYAYNIVYGIYLPILLLIKITFYISGMHSFVSVFLFCRMRMYALLFGFVTIIIVHGLIRLL